MEMAVRRSHQPGIRSSTEADRFRSAPDSWGSVFVPLRANVSTFLSARTPPDSTVFSEWTAPSTPLFLIYRDWPGNDVPKEDYRVIDTIGDLRDWISKAKDYRRFLVQDVFLGTFTPLLGFALFLIDWKTETRKQR